MKVYGSLAFMPSSPVPVMTNVVVLIVVTRGSEIPFLVDAGIVDGLLHDGVWLRTERHWKGER